MFLFSLQAKSYVPKALEHYVDLLASGQDEPQWPENVNLELKDSSDHVVRVVTPTASVSTGFSDDEDDDVDEDEEDNSDVDIN